MTVSNRNALSLINATPFALELAAADADTLLANTTYTTLKSLQQVADAIGLDTHPLVGKKYPGLTPDPAVWPANKAEVLAQSENWELRVPAGYNPVGDPTALVFVVNQAGATFDLTAPSTLLDEEANARGWFYLSIKCITETTWGGEVACLSIDAALREVCGAYNIDQRRIYGIGASRGGSIVSRYAATRQSGHTFMPAAIVLVSPSCEMRQWNSKLPPSTGTGLPNANDNNFQHRAQSERPDNMDGAWGDSPAVNHRFRTSSALFYDIGSYAEYPSVSGDSGATVDVSRSIGVCLRNLFTWIIYDPSDALVTFPFQAQKLKAMLDALLPGYAPAALTATSVATGFHGFGLLDVAGGVTSASIMDYFDAITGNRYPIPQHVVACDDTDYGPSRPFRTDVNDTARWTMAYAGTTGLALTNVTRLSRIDIDVSNLSLLRTFLASVGTPFTVTSSAGVVLRLKNLAFTPTTVSGTGILAGGLNVGYTFGLDGTNSVEIQPAAVGTAMSVSFY